MGIFQKPAIHSGSKKREMPEGLWRKCDECGEVNHRLELEQNNNVCPKCDHHMALSGRQRVTLLLDEGTFVESDADMISVDALHFQGVAAYAERLTTYQQRTGLLDAALCGTGAIEGIPVALAVMDFAFLAATMGSVVGEKITRTIETATKKNIPVVIVSASGGARMYEGMLSLMQMAKTCGALSYHSLAGLPFISVLTNPTTAGVMASFASVGDLIVAEPKCMIGFAGPRVIKETTHQELPPGFQTAEFLKDRGLVDAIIHRNKMKASLASILRYLVPKK